MLLLGRTAWRLTRAVGVRPFKTEPGVDIEHAVEYWGRCAVGVR
jgi:hypothetical protein